MAQPDRPKLQYIDRPDLAETFVDSVRHVTFDGATMRVELCVTRLEEGPAGAAVSTKQYPASRLVLRPDAAVDLFVRLQRLMALMEQRGVIKREQPKKEQGRTDEILQNPLGSESEATDRKH